MRFNLFIYKLITLHSFSNGRCSTYVGIGIDDFTARSTTSTAVRIRAGIRRKIISSLLRIAEKTSVLQRYPRGGHAFN